jgi:hypothetical protein
MLIVAIDVGVKNLAYCAMRDGQVLEWQNAPLLEPDERYKPSHLVMYVARWARRNSALLHSADRVVIERQMRCNMRIIEAALHALHYEKCSIVSACDVKDRFGLRMNNYRLNKKAAVAHVDLHLHTQRDEQWRALFEVSSKKDDLADSYLMALAFSEQHAGVPHDATPLGPAV